ncbi:MAG: sensor histidine kinase N-terminal domain-containing protein [Burkholderiales bacterium]|nr:sensor histidine kinase N-terminal domain-containing protein [Burkholderiales bacterium]
MINTAELTTPTWSLRRTLLAILLTLTISVWGFSAVVVYFDADQESQELFDQSLAETAHLLLTLADHEVEERMAMSASTLAESNNDSHNQYLLFQIWDNNHHLLYKNTGAPDLPFSADGQTGFGWHTLDGRQWRTYTSWNTSQHLQIQVGEPISHRKQISGRFAIKLLALALIIVPLLAGAIWWAVNRVFQSLQGFAEAVAQRTPNDLRQLNAAGAPSEVLPLLQAINRLFGRVSQTLEHEQRFTADAAHELRTPLAAIKTNLQVIQRARNPQERDEAVSGLATSVDRATRLVEQLMTLARLEPQHQKVQQMVMQDVSAVLRTQLPYWEAQADKLGLHFETQLDAASCLIQPESLLILFRNIMDNAFRYTPAGGRIVLSCRTEQGRVLLRVCDSGSGIPPAMRARVFERFVRLSDASKPGSGLGLSIVQRIAQVHGATLSLADGLDGQGLCVQLLFPDSPPA